MNNRELNPELNYSLLLLSSTLYSIVDCSCSPRQGLNQSWTSKLDAISIEYYDPENALFTENK